MKIRNVIVAMFLTFTASICAQNAKSYSPKKYVSILPEEKTKVNADNNFAAVAQQTAAEKKTKSDVDMNIPLVSTSANDSTFALIIANENYKNFCNVEYAINDSKMFAEYCQKVLGLPKVNITYTEDATKSNIKQGINKIKKLSDLCSGQCNIIFYYAGHGVPDAETHKQYLLPTDAFDGEINDESCYAIDRINEEFSEMNAKSVVMFIDACFSGASRTCEDLALSPARAVGISTKKSKPAGNVVVFSAASSQQTAQPYEEMGHGLFTYFLLKKLQQTKGEVTLGELEEYIRKNVAMTSLLVNNKDQTPDINIGAGFTDKWKSHKLR